MNRIATTILLCVSVMVLNAQELKINLSTDKNKINRDTRNGIATIAFESSIKNLNIVNEMEDEKIDISDELVFYLIQPETDEYVQQLGYPRRTFLLKASNTNEYVLETPEIRPNTVTYYIVTLQNKFPFSLSAEYLFTQSSKYGIRLSIGNKFGGYVSYKWGEYIASGKNLEEIHTDTDLTNAKNLGFIRTSITAGVRFGLLHKNISNSQYGLYLLLGGGYGEYGRQWRNPTQVEGNIYFYSDYMKGFNGELALQMTLCDWFTFSAGADILVDKGKVSIDYMLGIGANLNF